MTATCEANIAKTIKILKQLDEKSLLLIDSGAKLLAARQKLDEKDNKENAKQK